MTANGGTSDPTQGIRKIPIWGFLLIAIVYIAIIQIGGLVIGGAVETSDDGLIETSDILWNMWLPLGIALVYVYGVAAWLGWMRPVMHDHKPVQDWLVVVPVIFIVAILIGINYADLADKGIAYVLALLVATQLVGFGEEGMFRGIGVTALRINGLTEGKVALWSSVIFGAVHLSNAVGKGTGAIPQAILVSLAGYFFYLIRRRSHGNVVNSIVHGLFDFSLLSGTVILVDQEIYPGGLAPVSVYVILAIVLLVRRHKIEPVAASPSTQVA